MESLIIGVDHYPTEDLSEEEAKNMGIENLIESDSGDLLDEIVIH